MALFCEVELRIGWVPQGSGNTFIGQGAQANVPGQGQTQVARINFEAQVRQYIAGESVPVAVGSEGSVTLANINTALTNIVTDFAGASGTPIITAAELALIQGWATGSP